MRHAAIASFLFLGACASEPEQREPVGIIIRPPEALLSCRNAPTVPGRDATEADVAPFLLRYAEAHADCKGKLAAVKRYVND